MMDVTFEYATLAYTTPVPVRGRLIRDNTFLKVRVLEKDYYLSSLPFFHETTLPEIAFRIESFFSKYTLNFKGIDLGKKFFNLIPLDNHLDSMNGEMLFHIESLLLGMIRTTHPHLFSSEEILLNTLYSGEKPLDFYTDKECIKIKIHPQKNSETISLIKSLHEINPTALIRLDGNRRFELDELIHLHDELIHEIPESALKIDYIEEPFKNFYDTFTFEKRSKITLAIDESYKFYMADFSLDNPAVIKPSVIGLSPIFFWLRFCQDKRAIISSTFEHPSIMINLLEIARLRPKEFHGLENFH